MGGVEAAWLAGKTIKTICGAITGTNTVYTFALNGAYYQVTAGLTFKALRIKYMSSVAGVTFGISYGDDAKGDGTVAPTNEVVMITTNQLVGTVANALYVNDIFFTVPAGKYPCLRSVATNATKTMIIEGVEE